jgi:hypothetical protein
MSSESDDKSPSSPEPEVKKSAVVLRAEARRAKILAKPGLRLLAAQGELVCRYYLY